MYVGNGLSICETEKICGKSHKYVGNGKKCGKWLRYLANAFINWENDLKIWEMAKIFGKLLRYMDHGFSI